MAANTVPIYSKQGNIAWSTLITAATTQRDGTGTVSTIFTASTNGSRVDRIRARAAGTNVVTVLRVWINNGQTSTSAANNVLYTEKTLTATTISEVAALANYELPDTTDPTAFPIVLPAGYKINVALSSGVAAGYYVGAVGSDY